MHRFLSFPGFARLSMGVALLLAASACHKDDTASAPSQVVFTQTALYPEGTQYDNRNGRFLVSSQTAGRIGQVADDGTYAQFADDPLLISTIGLKIDQSNGRNRLLAAVSDPGYNTTRTTTATQRKLAALAVFDATSGARTAYINLGALRPNAAAHFANDIAVDDVGNIFVTDSYAPLIYIVNVQSGTSGVLLEDPAFAAPAGKFGLNGIAYHSGYLIVAKSDEGKLFKVSLTAPGGFSAISAPGLDLSGADGIQLVDDNTLLVSCNAQSKVYRLSSTDNFASVSQTGVFTTAAGAYPTTLARRGSESYVLYSYLNSLQNMVSPPVSQFSLVKTVF